MDPNDPRTARLQRLQRPILSSAGYDDPEDDEDEEVFLPVPLASFVAPSGTKEEDIRKTTVPHSLIPATTAVVMPPPPPVSAYIPRSERVSAFKAELTELEVSDSLYAMAAVHQQIQQQHHESPGGGTAMTSVPQAGRGFDPSGPPDDDDTIDPEGERRRWQARQEERLKAYLMAKESEANEKTERERRRKMTDAERAVEDRARFLQ